MPELLKIDMAKMRGGCPGASPQVAKTGSASGNLVWSSAFRRPASKGGAQKAPPKGGTPNPEVLRLTDVQLSEMRPAALGRTFASCKIGLRLEESCLEFRLEAAGG